MKHLLSLNFTLAELTRSVTACRVGIDNLPSLKEQDNLLALCHDILQPLRESWGEPIIVSSGYRCLFDLAVRLMGEGKLKNVKQIIDEHDYSWLHISRQDGRSTKRNQVLHRS